MTRLTACHTLETIVEERPSSLEIKSETLAIPSSGTIWVFEDAPSTLPYWCHWCGAIGAACLVHVLMGTSWLLSFLLTGLAGAGLSLVIMPQWHKLGLALRHSMAFSSIGLVRQLAGSEPLLVAYHRQPNGSATYAQIMNFPSMLQISPETLRARALQVLESLESRNKAA